MAEDLATLKERTSIEEVVREHVTLRRSGSSLVGLCPFHDEKSPSFNVNPTTNHYYCFGCGEGGDAISFVQKVEHLTFTEAVERLATRIGMEVRHEDGGTSRRDDVGIGRRARLVEILSRGIDDGDLRPGIDPEGLADLLTGPLLQAMVVGSGIVDGEALRAHVDVIVDGIGVRLAS